MNPLFLILIYFLASFALLAGAVALLRLILHRSHRVPQSLRTVTLLVRVPKEFRMDEDKRKETKELIAPFELFFANLGGMKPQRGLTPFFFGRHDHMAFEIVAERTGAIAFYVTVPLFLRRFVEQQLQAQAPFAQIDPVPDYNIFSPKGIIMGGYLVLRKRYIYPIHTYEKMNSDPLDAITNSLSKIEEGDGAAIQIIARSAHKRWHRWGYRVASQMQQGKSAEKAVRSAGGGGVLGFFGGIGTSLFGSSKKKDEQDYPEKQYHLSPMEEEIVKLLEEKSGKSGFDVNIRVLASAQNEEKAKLYLQTIMNAFSQFDAYGYGNGFKSKRFVKQSSVIQNFIYRNYKRRQSYVLNAAEMTSLFHMPLPKTETPNIRWLPARKAPAPVNMPRDGLILGRNVYRGIETVVRMKRADRRRHLYIIGKSGSGKSVLMENCAVQDIRNGEGVCVVDPHGDLIESILSQVPKERADDVIVFDPSDTDRPIGLNMLEYRSEEERDFSVQEMIRIFQKLFPPEMIGPMFEHNMRNVMLTLMADKEQPGTIVEIPRMFTDPAYQKYKYQKVHDPMVRAFWEKEMAQTTDFHKSEMLGYLISKVGQFVENEMMRNIIGQPKSGFDIFDIMNNRKILLVNLSKGKTGEINSSLLGLIIVSKIQMAALRRANLPESERSDFYLYIDEFQNFVTESIATILSEARKYRLNLIIAHQYIGQLVKQNDTSIRDAVFGNAGTVAAFRIGVEDAEMVAKEFEPVFNQFDVVNIEQFTAYVKLLIDNTASKAFNMMTYPPVPPDPAYAAKIKELSRLKYGRPRAQVEAEVFERSKLGESMKKAATPAAEASL